MNYEEAKDQAAIANGFKHFTHFKESISIIEELLEDAMQIYAEAKAKEFAEWCHDERWENCDRGHYRKTVGSFKGKTQWLYLTFSELYNIFNNG